MTTEEAQKAVDYGIRIGLIKVNNDPPVDPDNWARDKRNFLRRRMRAQRKYAALREKACRG